MTFSYLLWHQYMHTFTVCRQDCAYDISPFIIMQIIFIHYILLIYTSRPVKYEIYWNLWITKYTRVCAAQIVLSTANKSWDWNREKKLCENEVIYTRWNLSAFPPLCHLTLLMTDLCVCRYGWWSRESGCTWRESSSAVTSAHNYQRRPRNLTKLTRHSKRYSVL